MNSTTTSPAATVPAAERLHVDHGVTKRLDRWTSASQFEVRVRSGVLVLDLAPGSRAILALLPGDRRRTDGCCQVLGWADPSTVLFLVPSDDGPWLVAWDVESGQFSRASRLQAPALEGPVLVLDTGQRQ